jgi:hypothetical protein
MSQLIIKFTSNYSQFHKLLNRFIRIYNHIYAEHIKDRVFFEVLEEGMIGLYDDFEIFRNLIEPKKRNYSGKHKLSQNLLMKTIVRKSFPKEGWHIRMECKSHPIENLHEVIKTYFQRIDPEINVQIFNSEEIIAIFPKFINCCNYLEYLFYTISKK